VTLVDMVLMDKKLTELSDAELMAPKARVVSLEAPQTEQLH
jgi:hypothetical protein